jgi:hypothetical protein
VNSLVDNALVRPVSSGPFHHFYGFHDLDQWNERGDLMLGLEVSDISSPPVPRMPAHSGTIDPESGQFHSIHDTIAYNYPQGARQQWIAGSDNYIANDLVGGVWGSRILDARGRKILETLSFPNYCLNRNGRFSYHPSFARLQSAGGYGYTGVPDRNLGVQHPIDCGIWVGDLNANRSDLLVSILQVAQIGETRAVKTGYPHYLSHLVLNPSHNRIAFLHRYRLQDGGETTRLLTVGVDGSDLRLLVKGDLSHFDWLNDDDVMIWGESTSVLSRFRELPFAHNTMVKSAFGISKTIIRVVRDVAKKTGSAVSPKKFLRVTDHRPPELSFIGGQTLVEDGHPMVCPANRRWLINDTYPNEYGLRTLMIYDLVNDCRSDIGRFPMLNEQAEQDICDRQVFERDFDPRVLARFDRTKLIFNRSGLHCDLHPRWKSDGSKASFDSFYNGRRQVYIVEFKRSLF